MTTREWLGGWRHRHEQGEGDLPAGPLPAPQGVEDTAVLLAWRDLLGLPPHEASPGQIADAVSRVEPGLQAITAQALTAADEYLATDTAASTGLVLRYRDSRDGKRPVSRDGKVYPAIEYSGLRADHPLRARLQAEDCYHAGGDRRVILGPPAASIEAVQPYRWCSAEYVEALTRHWEADRRADLARGIRR